MGNKLKAVLVGCGAMSRAWLESATVIPDVEISGLVDVIVDSAKARADEFNLSEAIIDSELASVLDHIKPDVVFDCTVPEAHVDVTLAALRSGAHVLGEKPMSDSLDNARRMIRAAEESNRLYAVVQQRRYDSHIISLRSFLKSGQIGPLTTVNSDFFLGAHFGGFRDHMPHVLLMDMAIHTFDAVRFLAGADPVSVYCKEWNPDGSWYDRDASAVAIFEFSNKMVYTYRGSWCAEGLHTTWESDWRIIGQQGTVKWDGNDKIIAQRVKETGGFFSQFEELTIQPASLAQEQLGHSGIIREFLNAVTTGQTPQTICTDNIKSLAMVFGAIESAQTDRTVEIRVDW
jgi:predicted dehydrogenase